MSCTIVHCSTNMGLDWQAHEVSEHLPPLYRVPQAGWLDGSVSPRPRRRARGQIFGVRLTASKCRGLWGDFQNQGAPGIG